MTEKSLHLHVVVIHPLISIALPSVFVLTLHALLRAALGLPARFPDLLIALAPAASVMEAVSGNTAKRERAGAGRRVREIGVSLLVLLGLFISVSAPLGHYLYLSGMVILSWGLSAGLHAALRPREELLRSTDPKSGPEMGRAMHRALLLEQDALGGIRIVRIAAALMQGIVLLASAVVVFAGGRIGAAASLLLVLGAVVRHLVVAELSAFAVEQRLLAEGLRPGAAARGARIAHGLLLLGASVLLALASARSRPLLSLARAFELLERLRASIAARGPLLGPRARALLERFFAWLAGLFPRFPAGVPLDLLPPSLPAGGEPSPLLRRIVFAAGMTVLVVGIGAAIAFLAGPLARRDVEEGAPRKRPLTFLRRRLQLLGRLARALVSSLSGALAEIAGAVRRRARGLPGEAWPPRAAPAAASGRPAPRSLPALAERRRVRSARQRALRSFRAVAAWCGRQGLEYRDCLGPLEFAREAGRRFPDRAPALESTALLVERLLYRGRPAAREEYVTLARAVRSVLRGRG